MKPSTTHYLSTTVDIGVIYNYVELIFILDSVLSFDVDNKPAFEIPLKDVSSATTGMSNLS